MSCNEYGKQHESKNEAGRVESRALASAKSEVYLWGDKLRGWQLLPSVKFLRLLRRRSTNLDSLAVIKIVQCLPTNQSFPITERCFVAIHYVFIDGVGLGLGNTLTNSRIFKGIRG